MMDWSSPRLARFAAVELALWAGLYGLYLAVRGLAIGAPGEADAHAADVVGFERVLGVFYERQLQHALLPAADVFSAYYVLGFGPLVAAVAIGLAVRQPERYRQLRTTLLLSLGLATIVFVAFPTAPPRLLPGSGIEDTVGLSGHDAGSFLGIRFDPYAAVPSMHVGWSAIVAYAGFRATRRRSLRAFFLAHPALMAVTVASTGNHFFVDAAAGLAVAGLAIARVRWCRKPSGTRRPGADGRGRVSSPNRRAVDRPRGVQLGSGTIRMYGFGSSQLPKSSFASSLETEPAMITSSPCCQLTGVDTLYFEVSCSESMTRSTSSKLRPVVIG
jgi:hypothetical protein